MAWTTPRTWTPGELVTASMFNVGLRDNLNAIRAGDMAATYTTVTHDNSYYTGAGVDASWDVALADQQVFQYIKYGKMIHVMLTVAASTVASTPATLQVVVPGGAGASVAAGGAFYYLDNNTPGIGRWSVSSTPINFQKYDGSNWQNSTNLTTVQADMTFATS